MSRGKAVSIDGGEERTIVGRKKLRIMVNALGISDAQVQDALDVLPPKPLYVYL